MVELKTHYQKVFDALKLVEAELTHDEHNIRVQEGTLASDLHNYYNIIGQKEGWLKLEYATPLSQQDQITQIKNIEAALDVVKFWLNMFVRGGVAFFIKINI